MKLLINRTTRLTQAILLSVTGSRTLKSPVDKLQIVELLWRPWDRAICQHFRWKFVPWNEIFTTVDLNERLLKSETQLSVTPYLEKQVSIISIWVEVSTHIFKYSRWALHKKTYLLLELKYICRIFAKFWSNNLMWKKTEDKSSKHRIRIFEMPPRTSLGRGMPFLTEIVINVSSLCRFFFCRLSSGWRCGSVCKAFQKVVLIMSDLYFAFSDMRRVAP